MKLEKPFVKLLKSPNAGYFFDVNRNEIIAVSDEAYEFLEQEQAGVDCEATEEVFAELEALREAGYLSGNKVKEIRHPLTDKVDAILNRSMRKMTIQLTQDCNFRCSYCVYSQSNDIQRHHNKKQISMDTAKKAILFLHKHSVDADDVNIGFYGGEPLLEFSFLKEMTLFAKETFDGKEISFAMTTNGTLLTEEAISFLAENKFNIMLSVDGIKKIHDKNRVFAEGSQSTFDTIERRMIFIRDNYPDFFKLLHINMVIDPSSNYDEVCEIFKHPVFKDMKIQATLIDDSMLDKPNEFSEDYLVKSTYEGFLSKLCLLNRVPFEKLSTFNKDLLVREYDALKKIQPFIKLPKKWTPAGPCIPGELRMMVNVDGNFIACERVSETSDCMIIGNVEDGFYLEKVKALINIGALTKEQCASCFAFSACGMCAKDADDNGILSGNRKLNFCSKHQKNFLYQLKEIILLKEANLYF